MFNHKDMKTIVIFLIIGLTLLVSWQLYGAYVTNKSPNMEPELIGVKNGILFKKYLNYQKASVSIDHMSSSNQKNRTACRSQGRQPQLQALAGPGGRSFHEGSQERPPRTPKGRPGTH